MTSFTKYTDEKLLKIFWVEKLHSMKYLFEEIIPFCIKLADPTTIATKIPKT